MERLHGAFDGGRQVQDRSVGSEFSPATAAVDPSLPTGLTTSGLASRLAGNMTSGWADGEVMNGDPRNPKPKLGSLFANSLGQALGDTLTHYLATPENTAQQDFRQSEIRDRNATNGTSLTLGGTWGQGGVPTGSSQDLGSLAPNPATDPAEFAAMDFAVPASNVGQSSSSPSTTFPPFAKLPTPSLDSQIGDWLANNYHSNTAFCTAQPGEGLLAVGACINRSDPFAGMAYLAVSGQSNYDSKSNTWSVTPGRMYSGDMTELSAGQISALSQAAHNDVGAETAIRLRRMLQASAAAPQPTVAAGGNSACNVLIYDPSAPLNQGWSDIPVDQQIRLMNLNNHEGPYAVAGDTREIESTDPVAEAYKGTFEYQQAQSLQVAEVVAASLTPAGIAANTLFTGAEIVHDFNNGDYGSAAGKTALLALPVAANRGTMLLNDLKLASSIGTDATTADAVLVGNTAQVADEAALGGAA
ncbi:MAG TPA: hypothetical protein VF457_13540 [Burkholderiaceae bacterium]